MRRFSLPLGCVAMCASLVALVALASLQLQCESVPEDRQLHIVDDESGDAMDVTNSVFGSASLQGVHGFSADVLSCSSVFRQVVQPWDPCQPTVSTQMSTQASPNPPSRIRKITDNLFIRHHVFNQPYSSCVKTEGMYGSIREL